jgi:protein-tyrosine phosphatase
MYVDLHMHLLPGIDDGAADLDAAIAHVRRLEAAGVRDVACTPHVKRNEFPGVRIAELAERRAALERAVHEARLDVRLHGGGELAHEEALALGPDELELIAQGPPGGRWLLLEAPFEGIEDALVDAVTRLRFLGFGVLLAHPERSATLTMLDEATAHGALLQVNVSSLAGDHGRTARAVARQLVRDARVHCVASDGHPGTRDRLLADGHDLLVADGLTPGAARRLLEHNPRALLREGADPRPSRSAARSWSARRPRWAASAAC